MRRFLAGISRSGATVFGRPGLGPFATVFGRLGLEIAYCSGATVFGWPASASIFANIAISMAVIRPMQWGESNASAFLSQWNSEISLRDGAMLAKCGNDVYAYLTEKLFLVLNTVKSPGQAGWAFIMAKRSDLIHCLVWADGTKAQASPLGTPVPGERWWPCVVIQSSTALLPFYCPALAWSHSRPWEVHSSRIRTVHPDIPPPMPTPTDAEVAATPDPFTTSTVTIEEVDESSDETFCDPDPFTTSTVTIEEVDESSDEKYVIIEEVSSGEEFW